MEYLGRLLAMGFLIILSAMSLAGGQTDHSDGSGLDVREKLRQQTNQNTIQIVTGGINGADLYITDDLASVVDANRMRILPVVGRSAMENITDLLYLQGIDIAIVQTDALDHIRQQKNYLDLRDRVHYITKLFNQELHILAAPEITSLQDLQGKTINVDLPGSGTEITTNRILDALDITVEITHDDTDTALQQLELGAIDAMAYVAGKPTRLFQTVDPSSGLHFLPVAFDPENMEDYLPTQLLHDDYPGLVAEDQEVATVAVGTIMAAYHWHYKNDRSQELATFVDSFFNKIKILQQPPRHPKWRELSLSAQVPGWTRLDAAEHWLEQQR